MHIWVTRTEPGASRLAAALRAAGHTAWVYPTLAIECLTAPPPPGTFALTVFLSEHAVTTAFMNGWAPSPAIAIGAATSAALQARGVTPRIPATATSEGIIDLLADATPNLGGRILIAAGEGGRDTLLAWLTEAGHDAASWPLYRRVPQRGSLPASTTIDAIVVGSVAGLQAAAKLWFPSGQCPATPIVAPSQRVADAARTLGFTHVFTAAAADATATLAALRQTPSEVCKENN